MDPIKISFVDALEWPLMVVDQRGIIVHANKYFLSAVAHLDIDVLKGRPYLETLQELSGEQGRAISYSPGADFLYLRTKEDRTFRIDVTPGPDALEEGARLILLVDVTREARFEDELRQQRAATTHSAKMKALGEMACGIAHEVNNPLAIIQARAGFLKDQAQKDKLDVSRVTEAARQIGAVVERISKIIRGLRSFAKDEEGENSQDVFFGALLEDVLVLCRERFKNHGVELRVSSFDPTLSLQCRPIQISQVLLNLLNNGFDAVDEAQEKWISVEVTEEETNLLIRIGDSGTGVPAEIRDKIFDPFFTTKSANGGTGLGLSLSRGIIESHGGTLQLETSNGGSWFLVTLPKVAACRD